MHDVWRCPACRSRLDVDGDRLVCRGCLTTYGIIGGIPDFRVVDTHWIDVDRDRHQALKLLELRSADTAALVARVFADRGLLTPERQAQRTSQVLQGRERARDALDDWLRQPTTGRLAFLDLGCGPGQLLAAGALCGRPGVGIDVSLEWLVVAQRFIIESGGTPVLAAALGEALPLADGSVGGVVSLDTIEHVADQRGYLAEIGRVVSPDGVVAISTPNRYSLSAEPHVGVWGVGWLPRRWQATYVRRRSGLPYEYCRLLGLREFRHLFDAVGLLPRIDPGRVPADELRRFRPAKAWLARRYNRFLQYSIGRASLLPICPFFCALAAKVSRPRAS